MKPQKHQQAPKVLDPEDTEIYSIKWNNYPSTMVTVFRKYLRDSKLTDVVLSCDGGKSIQCHGVILAACSTYFEEVLTRKPQPPHNAVFFLRNIQFWELEAIITFMYYGEVRVARHRLSRLVKAAASLRVKGLASDGDSDPDDTLDLDETRTEKKSANVEPGLASTSRQAQAPPVPIKRKRSFQAPAALPRPQTKTTNGVAPKAVGPPQNQPLVVKPTPGRLSDEEVKKIKEYEREAVQGWSKEERQAAGVEDIEELISDEFEGEPDDQEPEDNENEVGTEETMEEDVEYAGEGDVETDTEEQTEGMGEDGASSDDQENDEFEEDEFVDSRSSEAPSSARRRFPYDPELRSQALAAIRNGLTIRECSDQFSVPRKTLSKWKQREPMGGSAAPSDYTDGGLSITESGPSAKKKRGPGVSIDSGDRAARLQKAMEMALSGITVRQAAANFEIPRTTLCAYMKRRGVTARRTFVNRPKNRTDPAPETEDEGLAFLSGGLFAGLGDVDGLEIESEDMDPNDDDGEGEMEDEN